MISPLPLPAYAPDQTVNSGVLLVARNVYPAVDGYRPIGDILEISDALSGTFNGGTSAIASDGTGYLFAGTSTALYRLASNGSWTTIVSGLTVAKRWKYAQFGAYIVSVNGADTREIDFAAGTAAAIAGAPTGTSVAVVGDQVVIGQADGDIAKVQWSAFRDHTGWTDGVDQAGSLVMQTGGAVMGICGGEYGIILQRERIVRMTRTGDADTPFQFDEISSNYGCADGATIAQAGRTIFFRSDRGFMALEDGQSLRPIGSEKVDRTFEVAVSRDDYKRIYTAVDPQNKLVMWGVPGRPGTIWIYNFELDRWTTAELLFSGIFPGFTTSIGLDDLAVTYTNLDTMTISLDDPRWSLGNPRLWLLDETNKIGTLAGDTLAAQLDLGFTQFTPSRRARIRGIRPITDAITGVGMTVNAKARLGNVDAIKTAGSLRTSGIMPVRAAGRFISVSITIAAGSDWSYIQGLEVEAKAGGER